VNYYRWLVSPDLKLQEVRVGDQVVTADVQTLETSTGVLLTQIGVLVVVPAHTTQTVTLTFSRPSVFLPQHVFYIAPQSGVKAAFTTRLGTLRDVQTLRELQ
jgi:hypothetical protein